MECVHKKDHIWGTSNEVDEPRAYETGKSVGKRKTWTLEGWSWQICSRSSSGDADLKNRLTDKGGEQGRGWDEWGEQHGCMHTNLSWEFAVWLRELKLGLSNSLERWEWVGCGRESQEWGATRTPMVNSCWCMTNQTNIIKQWSIN